MYEPGQTDKCFFLTPVNRDDDIRAKSGRVGVVKRVDEAWTAV